MGKWPKIGSCFTPSHPFWPLLGVSCKGSTSSHPAFCDPIMAPCTSMLCRDVMLRITLLAAGFIIGGWRQHAVHACDATLY